jgi:hypothetical protein
MNKENAIHFLPLVKALALGDTIQMRSADGKEWYDCSNVGFGDRPHNYRIKPKEEYVVAHVTLPGKYAHISSNAIYSHRYTDLAKAKTEAARVGAAVFKLVEVT